MRARLEYRMMVCVFALARACFAADGQVYQVGPDVQNNSAPAAQQNHSQEKALGWGSNIQNARLARSAQLALQHGDRAQALEYAQRAAEAAPNDPQLWLLLGYAARLDGKYQQSVDAYNRGLHLNPSSLEALSGLAQDYSLMGRTEDAERLLKQVISSDPKRGDDELLLGDLYMRSGNYNEALDWLGKAERMEPGARSELLMALCYQHLKQMDQASHYLDLARRRAPENVDVQRSMAGYFRETGNYAESISALKSIRNPTPDVKAELAYTLQINGKQNDSAKLYAEAANAMTKDLSLQLAAAQAEVAIGSIDQANAFLHRAAALDRDHYRLHAIRGQIAQMQDRDEEAIREDSAALIKLPASPAEGPLYRIQLHMDLMELYKNLKDNGAAQSQLKTAQSEINLIEWPGSGRGQYLRLRALIELNAGELDGAQKDINQALAADSRNRDNLQLDGDILMKMGRVEDAIAVYKQVLALDANNRFALTSLGYASRAAGRDSDAERYFERLSQANPELYIPYLALGDLYTSRRQFTKAQDSYSKGYALAPRNALIVAGGMNAAIEAHDLGLAATWLSRVRGEMAEESQVLREKERYLSFKGNYLESEEAGREAIKLLPDDRDVVVYLGYDLLHIEKYDELLNLTTKYQNVLPKEPDIPLLAGYVHKREGLSEQARADFTEALNRDPDVVTAYVNRGFMLNDLHQPKAAAADFEAAIKREPGDGEAHLGLAYADLDLARPQMALLQAETAQKIMGDSKDIHVIRASAFGREDLLGKEANEYRAALKFTPNDGGLHLALGNTLFAQQHFHDAIDELKIAENYSPDNALVYALLARSYANLEDREQTLRCLFLPPTRAYVLLNRVAQNHSRR